MTKGDKAVFKVIRDNFTSKAIRTRLRKAWTERATNREGVERLQAISHMIAADQWRFEAVLTIAREVEAGCHRE